MAQVEKERRSEIALNLGNAVLTAGHISTFHPTLPGCQQWGNWRVISVISMRNCPLCKSSKLLRVRGKIKRVAYHPAWLAPAQQLCPTLAESSDSQALQALLPGALG